MILSIAYCEKCGRVCAIIDTEKDKCDCCGYFPFKPIPHEYTDNFRWRDGDGKEAFMREVVETSPKLDKYYYENRERILNEKSMQTYEMRMRIQERMKNSSSVNTPKCPICGSTSLSRISTTSKAVKVGLFGIFGAGDIGKTYKCNSCGSRF